MIGEFEYLILASTLRLADDAYGASIRREIEAATAAPCSIGALYTTLDRLEAKGLVATRMGEPTAERGGRAKRMVRITPAGRTAAAEFFRTITHITADIVWSMR